MFGFKIIAVALFFLVAFSSLPTSDGDVICSFCPAEKAEFEKCENGNAFCPYKCVYYVYNEPPRQHWGCFDRGQWPAVDIVDRWNTLAEGEIINQNHYLPKIFHTGYVCSNADFCNRKSGYQRSDGTRWGGNRTTTPSSAGGFGPNPNSNPKHWQFQFYVSLIFNLFLLLPSFPLNH